MPSLMTSSLPLEDKVQLFIHENPSVFVSQLTNSENTEDLQYGFPVNIREKLTDHSKRIDNLLIDKDGIIYLIEAKRGLAYRDVIAQALDYAAFIKENFKSLKQFIENLAPENSTQIISEISAYRINETPNFQILITAYDIDPILDRIGRYLLDLGVPINFVRFRPIEETNQYIFIPHYSMDLIDQAIQKSQSSETINLFHITLDLSNTARNWENWKRFGFISAGGGEKYARELNKLKEGHLVVCRTSEKGFIGVGRILDQEPKPIKESKLAQTEPSEYILPNQLFHHQDDSSLCEWIREVEWLSIIDEGVCKDLTKGRWGTCKRIWDTKRIKAIKEAFPILEEYTDSSSKSQDIMASTNLNEMILQTFSALLRCEDSNKINQIQSLLGLKL
jgi:hypothetical protein